MLRLHGSPCCLQPALVEYGDVDAVDVDVEVDEVVDGPHLTLTQRGSKRDYYPF